MPEAADGQRKRDLPGDCSRSASSPLSESRGPFHVTGNHLGLAFGAVASAVLGVYSIISDLRSGTHARMKKADRRGDSRGASRTRQEVAAFQGPRPARRSDRRPQRSIAHTPPALRLDGRAVGTQSRVERSHRHCGGLRAGGSAAWLPSRASRRRPPIALVVERPSGVFRQASPRRQAGKVALTTTRCVRPHGESDAGRADDDAGVPLSGR